MFKKKSVTGEVLHDQRNAYESILKTTDLKNRARAEELAWANAEENPYFAVLFGKLAEIQFLYSEAEKKMAEKFLDVNKAFRNIFQEERILEETRKEEQNYLVKITKLQKQLDSAMKKGDQGKIQSLENDVSAQGNVYNQLSQSVEAKAMKLELYKLNLLKRGLRLQAEGMLTLSEHCQQLYTAQNQLIDLLPDAPGEATERKKNDLDQRMSAVITKVSSMLDITAPPIYGGVVLRKGSKLTAAASSPALKRQSLIESFSPFSSSKDEKKQKRLRHASLSATNMLAGMDLDKVEPQRPVSPPASPPPAYKPSVYCEIVIPGIHTSDRPVLAKSRSEDQLNLEDDLMSTRFDKRLKEAGLLKKSPPNSISPSSSMEDDLVNSDDPGYARLLVTPTGPVVERRDVKNLDTAGTGEDDDGGYANPADALKMSPHMRNLPAAPSSPLVPEKEFPQEDDGGYTNPADALRVSPRVLSLQKTPNTPSPPTSPLVSDPSSENYLAVYDSPYESVTVIRKMREQQIKEKANDEKRVTPAAATEEVGPQDDEQSGYSRPFDALKKAKKIRSPSDASSRKPPSSLPWQRTNSNSRIGNTEFSARAHHQIGSPSPSSSKGSLEHILDEFPKRRSASTSTANKPAPKPLPRGNKADPPPLPPPVSSKPGNLTSVSTSGIRTGSPVNRYILKVENGVSEEKENHLTRAESGRTRSVNSALNGPPPPPLRTPAKVTKLRDGRAKISGKTSGPTTSSPPTAADISTRK